MTLMQAGALEISSEGEDKILRLTDKYLRQLEDYVEKKKGKKK